MKKLLLLSISLFFFFVLPTDAVAADYYVSPSGSDNNTGSLNNPFRTISHGVGGLNPGDTLLVRGGIYHETISIENSGTAGSRITIKAYRDEKPIIDGKNTIPTGDQSQAKYSPLIYIKGSYVTVEGFEVKNSRGRGVSNYPGTHAIIRNNNIHHNYNAGINIQADYAVIERNNVWQNAQSNNPRSPATWPGALMAVNSSHHTIRGNTVFNNHGEGIITLRAGDVVIEDNVSYDNLKVQLYLDNAFDVLVQRNLVYCTDDRYWWRHVWEGDRATAATPGLIINDEDYCKFSDCSHPAMGHDQIVINNIVAGCNANIGVWSQHADSGLKNSIIANNTLIQAQADSSPVALQITPETGKSRDSKIYNNLIYQTRGDSLVVSSGGGISFSHNLWSKAVPSAGSGPGDIITQDPKLVNPDAKREPGRLITDWYKIDSSSQAINSAVSLPQVSDDFFRSDRKGVPDIGAHEHGSGTNTSTPTNIPSKNTDLDADGDIDFLDFNLLLVGFGSSYDIYYYNDMVREY